MARLPARSAIVLAPLLLAACAHAPSGGGATTFEGRVVSIDTAPWAYDGSGTLVVDTGTKTRRIALPARWNLCKGHGLDTAGELKAGDRVRVTGAVAADGGVDACSEPFASIERL